MFGGLDAASELPGNARTFKNIDDAFKHLEKYHGIDPILASDRLHDLKEFAGMGPADNFLVDMTGNVYNPYTLEYIGSLTAGGAKVIKP